MKIYIMTDIEGISGISSSNYASASKNRPDLIAEGRVLMAGDINACVEGCFQGGATEVIVKDCHGGGFNVTRSMIDLNVSALTEMCRGCIPCMGPGSRIINVCSASAYLPLEGLNVYSATKAYVRAFCCALGRELKDRGITVLEVSPGWVETDFIPLSRSSDDVPEAVFNHTVKARDVAVRAVADAKRGKRRSICGAYNRLQVFVCTHMPRAASYVWRRSLL